MSFEEFEKHARLYVMGRWNRMRQMGLKARRRFGKKAEDTIAKCYALHEAFALSLQPAKTSATLKDRLMAMVRERKQ